MASAGTYNSKVTHWKCTQNHTAGSTGTRETFANNGTLWASIDYTSGRRQRDFNSDQTGTVVTIKIRNSPSVAAIDRLEYDGTYFIIESIFPGDNEIILDCYTYDGIDLGGRV